VAIASLRRSGAAAELTATELAELRERLVQERAHVLDRVQDRLAEATPLPSQYPDEMDEASANQELALQFRLADKEQKLVAEIDAALQRLDSGTYGVCEGTGEPIGYRRLWLRPWARFSVNYKEELEREQAARPGR
jgi:DnaK suppressor protein